MSSRSENVRSIIDEYRPDLTPFEEIYKDIHSHPELGKQEKRTSSIASSHLRDLGYEVMEEIGGYGLVGILSNGTGPTVLLRADMDALPIKENTGLEYASTVEAVDEDGEKKPVMHACGHDTHVTSLLGCATLLMKAKSKWSGTLIVLFQPDEEHGEGARAMLDDGLYDKIPKPDIVLGQHLLPALAGTVHVRPGTFLASADSLKVVVHGREGHASSPQDAIDPIVIAASIIVRLQTVVAREIGPSDAATVTCASIHGGKAHNVIPDEVVILLNIRAFETDIRTKVLSAIRRIIKHEALASGAEKEPEITTINQYPPNINDDSSAQKLQSAFEGYFGKEKTMEASRSTASEDFSLLATEIGVPSLFWDFGGVGEEEWNNAMKKGGDGTGGKRLAQPHQADYAPVIEPTLRTGIEAMSIAALTFLGTP